MKISELIEKLQELQNVHGDIDVTIRDHEWMENSPVTVIEAVTPGDVTYVVISDRNY